MHIFIDESGLFSPEPNPRAWSSVGGVVIPDSSLDVVTAALNDLKIAQGIEINSEFKRNRPDCASTPYQTFLKILDEANCTLHVLSTRSSPIESEGLEAHRSATITSIRNYDYKVTDAEKHTEEVVALINSLSPQEYNQCILQIQMICEMLSKIVSYYAGILPDELGRFKWIIDRKNISENKYERSFKALYVGLVSIRSLKQGFPMLADRNYSAFITAFLQSKDTLELSPDLEKVYGIGTSWLANAAIPASFGDILQKEFSLENSEHYPGLQVADLLVSSVNRCLKQNYTDNESMAKALGNLMINAPRIEEQSIMVFGHGPTRSIENTPAKLIKLMNTSAKRLFSQTFRRNFSKNVPRR
ncbi:DUF3800 domain-containing protein [Burkholderia gladioli]|uniref:DUF3800 domain-containing protein n=1 Tax=Burkholderia gladioli TaxID=28095 RepID=UPI003F7AFA52